MGEGGLAPHQKKARRLNASLVFIDESGLLLAPVVRRSWAPCGQTPILYQRGRARDKVSIIAALTLSPRRRRTGLYFSLRANENVTTAWLVPFLRALSRHLRGAFVLVWDRLPGHRAHVVTAYLHRRHRAVALLPPYAPELNPVEILWAYLKSNPLANFAASDALHLAASRLAMFSASGVARSSCARSSKQRPSFFLVDRTLVMQVSISDRLG